jgi:hypothetical protein
MRGFRIQTWCDMTLVERVFECVIHHRLELLMSKQTLFNRCGYA